MGATTANTSSKSASPVDDVTSRAIDPKIRLHLFVVAGGHCEFTGCNDYLIEHHLTLTPGNFAEMAHIVAFKEKGPRGDVADRPENINNISNLMLLCPKCHKLIDDHPADHPREKLEEMKHAHEMRVRLGTSLGPEMRTSIVIFQAPIGGHHISVSPDDVRKAISPRYPASLPGTIVDLRTLAGSPDRNFLAAAQDQITNKVDSLFKTGGGKLLAEQYHIPFLGAVALDPLTVVAADAGIPVVCMQEESGAKRDFLALADSVDTACRKGSAVRVES